MSGLEVLGVVISGLPMVIGSVQASKAAQHLPSPSPIPKEGDIERILGKLIDTLKRQHYFLRKDLETILTSQSHILGRDKVAEILKQPHANYFRDADVVKTVRNVLGDGYEVYVSTVRKTGEGVFALTERLAGLKAPGTPRRFGRTAAPKKAEFERLLERLDGAAVLLARLRVAPAMGGGSSSLGSRQGTDRHLSMQTTERGSREGMSRGSREGALSRSKSVRVESGQKADTLYGSLLSGYGGCHPAHQTALWLPTGSELGSAFTVGFEIDGEERYYAVDVKVTPNTSSQLASDPSRRSITGSLCKTIATAQTESRALAMSVSHEGTLFCNDLEQPSGMPTTSELTNLNTILRRSTPGSWAISHKLRLSYIIASSVMQLCPTRWLLASLTSDSIYFTTDNAATLTNPSGLFTPKPLILRHFGSRDNAAAQYTSARSTLLELAILLLEIWHQKPFDSYIEDVKAPLDRDIWDRLRVVEGWAGDTTSGGGIIEFMFDIVTRCIHCTFASEFPVPDWEDSIFRSSFYDFVVEPLGRRYDVS